ncbi:tyrosine-type recombinase/integrase [Candidatus Latescibacterota bacterium]
MSKFLVVQPKTAPLTVAQAIQEFLDRDWTPNTLRNYRSDLGRFEMAFGPRPVASITPSDIQSHLDGLKSRSGSAVSPATHNRHHASIQSLFSWLERQEELDRSPMWKVDRRKMPERLPRPMTEEQLAGFFGNIKSRRDKALFSLLHRSGVRVCEGLGLNIEDVNLRDRSLRVMGKGGAERVGYLAEKTVKLLRQYLRERGNPKTGPLFLSRQGRLGYAMARVLFSGYAKGLPGEPVTIHQLRHSFGSERAGKIDAMLLRDLMGHRSLRTTQQYARVNPEAARKAFDAFDRQAATP